PETVGITPDQEDLTGAANQCYVRSRFCLVSITVDQVVEHPVLALTWQCAPTIRLRVAPARIDLLRDRMASFEAAHHPFEYPVGQKRRRSAVAVSAVGGHDIARTELLDLELVIR